MATYTGTAYIPNDINLDALFAVHCLGAMEITRDGKRTHYVLHGKVHHFTHACSRSPCSGYRTLPLWHIAPDRIIEDYDLVDVSITQTVGGWTFARGYILIHTHFSEYDQSEWIQEYHHARQKKDALAHGLLLIALALQGVDVNA